MKLIIRTTSDGSNTLESEVFRSTFHSRHGAIQESRHVFIKEGLDYLVTHQRPDSIIQIFEFGFGTGLNAWLTKLYADKYGIHVHYHTVDQFPVPLHVAEQLNYPALLSPASQQDFLSLHRADWDCPVPLSPGFVLHKVSGDALELRHTPGQYHLVYYDAFGPESQPDLWSPTTLLMMTQCLVEGGIFVTYCAKGEVRRSLIQAGMDIQRLPGPPGKREMLRGIKCPVVGD